MGYLVVAALFNRGKFGFATTSLYFPGQFLAAELPLSDAFEGEDFFEDGVGLGYCRYRFDGE